MWVKVKYMHCYISYIQMRPQKFQAIKPKLQCFPYISFATAIRAG